MVVSIEKQSQNQSTEFQEKSVFIWFINFFFFFKYLYIYLLYILYPQLFQILILPCWHHVSWSVFHSS